MTVPHSISMAFPHVSAINGVAITLLGLLTCTDSITRKSHKKDNRTEGFHSNVPSQML